MCACGKYLSNSRGCRLVRSDEQSARVTFRADFEYCVTSCVSNDPDADDQSCVLERAGRRAAATAQSYLEPPVEIIQHSKDGPRALWDTNRPLSPFRSFSINDGHLPLPPKKPRTHRMSEIGDAAHGQNPGAPLKADCGCVRDGLAVSSGLHSPTSPAFHQVMSDTERWASLTTTRG